MNPSTAQMIEDAKVQMKKPVGIPLWVIAVIALFMSLAGVGGYLGYKSFQRQVAKAEAKDKAYTTAAAKLDAEVKAHAADRAMNEKQEKKIEYRYITREIEAKKTVDDIKKIDPKDTEAVVRESEKTLGVKPAVEPDGKLGFDAPSVLMFAQTKVERDEAMLSKIDLKAALALSQENYASLSDDFTKEKALRKKCEDDKDSWKHIAVETKWHKVGRYALTTAAIGGAFYAGMEARH